MMNYLNKNLAVYIMFCVMVISACTNTKNDNTQDGSENAESPREIVKPLIDTLQEFKRVNNYIDSLTNHKQQATFMLDSARVARDSIVEVSVGLNGEERFETYFNMRVNLKTKELRFIDPQEGEELSLSAWRARNKFRGYPW